MRIRALLHRSLGLWGLLAVYALATACGGRTSGGGDDADTTGTTTDDTDTAESGDGDGDGDGDGETDTGNFLPDPDLGGGGNGGLGEMCQTDGDCADDLVCNGLPMQGGVCSECVGDQDCKDKDLGLNCSFNGMYFACGDGNLGEQCEEDSSCMGDLVCAEVIDLGGFFNGNFCSECKSDDMCTGGQLCNPQFDMMMGGQKACVDPGSVENGSMCDFAGTGDMACASGHCEDVDAFMGFVHLGVCGECEVDGDCPMGQTCTGGTVGMMLDVMPSTCG